MDPRELHDLEETPIVRNKELNLWEALIPLIALIVMLAFNVLEVFKDDALGGSNQFILLLGAAVAVIVGIYNKVSFDFMLEEVSENLKSTTSAILILLMVGALAGTWLISGIIPSMIYYGLELLHPSIFLPATLIICSLISIATGSSWTTSATVGIALVGIGGAIGFDKGMVAGAAISGAYFGDKLSPMSDTTNLAPAMAGTNLFTHIRYMTITTIPSYLLSFLIFIVLGLTTNTSGGADNLEMLNSLNQSFYISPFLFIVPAIVIFMIIKKTEPLIALFVGVLLGAVAALIFQPSIVLQVAGTDQADFKSFYKGIMNAITIETIIPTENESLKKLFEAGGMSGMLNTIWLIICAMVFGGVMEAIGALSRITQSLLNLFHTTFGLFASTVASCLAINITASDQYLSIVVPGKMFKKAYEEKNLAPENLSRTLEDSGTVTSVLVPWNTCGAYQSQVLLGHPGMTDYIPYAFFNIISPFMTLLIAAIGYKIKYIHPEKK